MGRILTRAVLDADGYTQRTIDAELTKGTLRRVTHAAYTRQPAGKPWDEHLLLIEAIALRGNWVFSHQSAAAVHGMAAYGFGYKTVHVTVDATGGGGIRGGLHIHARPLRAEDVVEVRGIRVTSPARTAADVAMNGDHGQALAIIDSARLRPRFPKAGARKPVTVDQLEEVAEYLGRRPGAPMYRRVIGESSEHSESAGESRTRAMLIDWKLPMPELQKHYLLSGSTYYADFSYPGMIGEFDGTAKYRNDPGRAEYEARRGGDFRRDGIAVVNWYWEDLADRERIYDILTKQMLHCGVIPRIPLFPG
ncbi:hypothetical protein FK529_10470 [Tsukamurella asaccharolytica]|uniref:Type IV toxin-antitoxin system AbiEi family antitoxin domain-containing protein n=1 Tax=Tsukamurella asaccharolytica TaxID=2592067 RepID=A0A5C5R9V2_9ACTN|nr:hypothetical protein [Tsukamurella asaccharolytica]TWS19598.1 hypothetical protein FK529_10470 [Tsukamurella asaccharolytica]